MNSFATAPAAPDAADGRLEAVHLGDMTRLLSGRWRLLAGAGIAAFAASWQGRARRWCSYLSRQAPDPWSETRPRRCAIFRPDRPGGARNNSLARGPRADGRAGSW